MYEFITFLSFGLAWFSIGVTIYVLHIQGKIRELAEQEKIKRRHMAIVRLGDSLFSLELDWEWYKDRFDTTYQSMTKEILDELHKTIQLYYPDLSAKEIQEAEEITSQTKSWLNHPIYEKNLTGTQRVTLIGSTYEEIFKKIEQLGKLLEETVDNLDKSIIKTF